MKIISSRGFTLFEVILYIAILSVVVYFVGGFAYNLYQGKDKIEALQEVNSNGRFMLDTMTRSIEQATAINTITTND